MPWFIDPKDGEYCVVKGTAEEPGEVEKCHPTEDEAKAHMKALYANVQEGEKADGEDAPLLSDSEKSLFFTYKSADGTPRWASVSNVAIKDKEYEIVTEKAYDDAIAHARETGDFGELDLVHVDGTDVGDCDFMARAGKRLIESGTWRDTPRAKGAMAAVEEDPDYWGVSIKFVYDPSNFDGEKYLGNIRIPKRTILPQEMAASFGTRFVAKTGGDLVDKELSKEKREALEKLGVSQEDIEELAEKQKAVTPEPNVVEKADEPEAETPEPEIVEVKKSVWEKLKEAVQNLVSTDAADEPDAETGGVENQEEVTEAPVEAQEEQPDMGEAMKALTDALMPKIAEIVTEATRPLTDNMAAMDARLKEAEEAVEDKVLGKLAELPKVVQVRASRVEATVQEDAPTGPVFPNTQGTPQADYAAKLFEGVTQAVADGINAALPGGKVEV